MQDIVLKIYATGDNSINNLIILLGQFNFEGNGDVVKFFKLAHEHGLWVSLRVGPYIAAEWNQG